MVAAYVRGYVAGMRMLQLLLAGLTLWIAGASTALADPPKLTANQRFAECIARGAPADSRALTLSAPGSPSEQVAHGSLYDMVARCQRAARSEGKAAGLFLLRGLLAERLWVRQVATFRAPDQPAPDPDRVDFEAPFRATPALKSNYALAFCVAYTRPDLIDALVRTPVASSEEASAITALKPVIARCYPEGSSLTLDRMTLRATFAEQLYRRYPPTPRTR